MSFSAIRSATANVVRAPSSMRLDDLAALLAAYIDTIATAIVRGGDRELVLAAAHLGRVAARVRLSTPEKGRGAHSINASVVLARINDRVAALEQAAAAVVGDVDAELAAERRAYTAEMHATQRLDAILAAVDEIVGDDNLGPEERERQLVEIIVRAKIAFLAPEIRA